MKSNQVKVLEETIKEYENDLEYYKERIVRIEILIDATKQKLNQIQND